MPDGETHLKFYSSGYKYVIFPSILGAATIDWKLFSGIVAGYLLGRWIDPDWDVMGSSSSEGRIVNEIPILGHFLFGISSTYGSIFRKHHRSFWTHFPVISTVVRLVFVFFVPFIIADSYGINLIGGGWIWFWAGILFGLSIADSIHYFLDIYYEKR